MSSSPPERRGGGGEGERGEEAAAPVARAAAGLGRRRSGDPSSSRQRSADEVWPEHFVEAVAAQVAVDATRSAGRLAAAPAVVAVFQDITQFPCLSCGGIDGDLQVCSTWRDVSRSELLWQDLCRRVWSRRRSSLPSWRDEFVRLHRTAANFRFRRCAYSQLLPASSDALSCRRLALSDHHLAAGFHDGSVLLFDLPAGQLLATYRADPHRDRLGRFSQAISGIILLAEPDESLTFSSQDGDIHVASLDVSGSVRRAHVGNLMEDGTLVDFTGDARWWVGLFAGVPGRSWHIWGADTEQLVYVGGTLTDSNAILGWHMLTDLSRPVLARTRIAEPGIVVGCTASSMEVVDLNDSGTILNQLELPHGAVVDSVDACEGRVMAADSRGLAKVREVPTLQELCRFGTGRRVEGQQQQGTVRVKACMNWCYAIVCSGRGVRVWDATTGAYLYSFRERIGEAAVAAASDRYISAWADDSGLHLWDFGDL
ncbi:transcriptional regulator STERILE APETALA-like [Musa acuminata AAA Group]|uniref:transcriptional regulator STERILE APETALA-like n=1 Tax=Musa acuminata AAA Group TaxID=214697 RepID=UPI0031DF9C5E